MVSHVFFYEYLLRKRKKLSKAWSDSPCWLSTLEGLRQDYCELEASMGNTTRPCFKKQTTTATKGNRTLRGETDLMSTYLVLTVCLVQFRLSISFHFILSLERVSAQDLKHAVSRGDLPWIPDPPAATSQLLGLQASVTLPSSVYIS